ncbi:NAD(P)/FAD-dependent oxidoreductase [Marinobacter mangrovi]|uniref:NAD(P)/FAD-dependent oxidoreductase n=1 Tax=Marinobacter mangrovi TaxID=2803918 RepID=UPI0019321493|nr:NAD(P)/FAD-dependent oxidoreductase [Marinobacter mangrovi]
MIEVRHTCDVVVIGAGPAGSVAAALLARRGYSVLVLEKSHFPRFSIGESLLPQCMEYLEQAGMLAAVQAEGFQFKDGAAFVKGDTYDHFNFTEKFSEGWGTTFQVERSRFDQILSQEAHRMGADIRFGHGVVALKRDAGQSTLTVEHEGNVFAVTSRFVLDASGFGRVLPRLLELDVPSTFPARTSIMTHVEDRITSADFDRNKILITVHPQFADVWYWLIPFSDGRASVGVVAPKAFLEARTGEPADVLQTLIAESGRTADFLAQARYDSETRVLSGYASNVSTLHGDGFALLGNAGEFLDPVFSSGVTIAMKSAFLAANALDRELQGEAVDWATDYAAALKKGVDTFRTFVEAWYDQRLQDVIFSAQKGEDIKRMISSILAGYAWDRRNPYVKHPQRLTTLAELCRLS